MSELTKRVVLLNKAASGHMDEAVRVFATMQDMVNVINGEINASKLHDLGKRDRVLSIVSLRKYLWTDKKTGRNIPNYYKGYIIRYSDIERTEKPEKKE